MEINVRFNFSRSDKKLEETVSFDAADSSLEATVSECADDLLAELDGWGFDGWEVIGYDEDWKSPDDFANLDDYGAYIEGVERHGVAYHLRYDDIYGEHDFENEYQGEWDSAEEFVQSFYEDCHDIPDHLVHYIDWEKLTRDIMMDYSEYEDNTGMVHIFRN